MSLNFNIKLNIQTGLEPWRVEYCFVPDTQDIKNWDTVRRKRVYDNLSNTDKLYHIKTAQYYANEFIYRMMKCE